jgi:hypothetical protein
VLLIKRYCGDKIDENVMGGACGTCGREERCLKCFGGQTWLKEATLKNIHRWEDNIKMHIQEVVLGGLDWIDLAQDRDGRGLWLMR